MADTDNTDSELDKRRFSVALQGTRDIRVCLPRRAEAIVTLVACVKAYIATLEQFCSDRNTATSGLFGGSRRVLEYCCDCLGAIRDALHSQGYSKTGKRNCLDFSQRRLYPEILTNLDFEASWIVGLTLARTEDIEVLRVKYF